MRKQAIHVKSYERSRHGRAKFGGKVREHDKDVSKAQPKAAPTAKGKMPELSVYCMKCKKKYKSTDYKIVTMPSGMRRAVPVHSCGTKGSVFLGMKKKEEKSGRASPDGTYALAAVLKKKREKEICPDCGRRFYEDDPSGFICPNRIHESGPKSGRAKRLHHR